jgi:protoheme ferro-lyase
MLKTTQEEAISLTFYPFYSETISFKAVKNIKKMNCASKDLQNDILHTYIPKTF